MIIKWWFFITALSFSFVLVAFDVYKWLYPRTYGFMGSESPYSIEGTFAFLLFVFFQPFNFILIKRLVSRQADKLNILRSAFLLSLLWGSVTLAMLVGLTQLSR